METAKIEELEKRINELEKQIADKNKQYTALTDIWNEHKRPFIAKNEDGYYVLIEKNLQKLKEQYHGKIYGTIDKEIKWIFKKESEEIQDMNFWKIIVLL